MPFYTIGYYLIINLINYKRRLKQIQKEMNIEFSKIPEDIKLL